jgi:cyclopropane fatty-acyl-phospholipid synthase-like methyltransferase
MSTDVATHLSALYAGDVGETWARIERESSATYWEENAVLGRRDSYAALLARLQPIEGRRILDAGCGRGLWSRRLAHAGALVTAVDLVVDHVLEAHERTKGPGPSFVAADFRDVAAGRRPFDEIILQEVLEDYRPEDRLDALRWLGESGAARVHVIFRQAGQWASLVTPLMPTALTSTLDPVQFLRSIHLHTPYRLSHQEFVRRRSYNVRRVELTL